jgi:hypothetical protein
MAFYFDHRSGESGVKNGDGKSGERRGKVENVVVLSTASGLENLFGGKDAGFRDRQSDGSSTSCFQEIAASHM